MSLQKLCGDTIQLVSSSQVITSVHSVVKELVENAIDAETTSIDIRLENYGLNLIQVRDNGTGIKKTDVPLLAIPHHTSKLSSFHDLSSLTTYGFRGEALSSVANIAELSITTATKEDELAHTYVIDHNGGIVETKPSSLGVGTTVAVSNIFKNFPVRKKVYKNTKRCNEELKKVEQLLMAFGLAFPKIRFSLKHNKMKVWEKEQTSEMKSNITLIFGPVLRQNLMPVHYQCFNPMVKMQVYVPKPSADLSLVARSKSDHLFVLVNNRPVEIKAISKTVRDAFVEAFPSQTGRYPVAIVMLSVLPEDVDVNLEPNKTTVLLHNIDFITTTLSSLLTQAYGPCKVPGGPSETPEGRETLHDPDVQKKDNPLRPKLSNVDTPQRCQDDTLPELSQEIAANVSDPRCSVESDCLQDRAGPLQVTDSDTLNAESNLSDHVSEQANNATPETAHASTSTSTANENSFPLDDTSPHVYNVPTPPHMESFNSAFDLTMSKQTWEQSNEDGPSDDFSYSLQDISELEKDFDSSSSSEDERLQSEDNERAVTGPTYEPTNKRLNAQGGTRQGSLLSWSRGEAITDTAETPVEPVRVLAAAPKDGDKAKSVTQSKLTFNKPSGVFDMLHSRPLKRTADSSLERERPVKKTREQLSNSPSITKFLTRPEQEQEERPVPVSADICFELDSIARRNELLWERTYSTLSSCHVVGSCCQGPQDVWIVLWKHTLLQFNIHRLHEAQQMPTVSRAEVETQFKDTLVEHAGDSVCTLTQTPYFQHLYTIDE